ncbi:MAG: hypothetical protein A4E65_00271 [Syntrophorhabdus sp. PtaU1.Bin153]|nr:MAG: hypothetical protein A4E65_00271 [Syntrophorhabdus sp. PtaU1.Bin153]
MRRVLVLPIKDWSLSSVAKWLGYRTTASDNSEMDGFSVGLAYELYSKLGERLPVKRIARRNIQDVQKLAFVSAWFRRQRQKYIVKKVTRCDKYEVVAVAGCRGCDF